MSLSYAISLTKRLAVVLVVGKFRLATSVIIFRICKTYAVTKTLSTL